MIIVKNFISKKICKDLINWHKEYWPKLKSDNELTEEHYGQYVINIHYVDKDIFKLIGAKLNYEIQKISKNHYSNYYQLTKCNTGCQALPHTDIKNHIWSSILYLNSNFKGGETIVGDEVVKPETGKLIIFEGAKISHSVNKITKGVRYTVPSWYNLYK